MAEFHQHNQSDGTPLLTGRSFLNSPQPEVDDVSESAGATYTTAERDIINDHGAKINEILRIMRVLQFIRE